MKQTGDTGSFSIDGAGRRDLASASHVHQTVETSRPVASRDLCSTRTLQCGFSNTERLVCWRDLSETTVQTFLPLQAECSEHR